MSLPEPNRSVIAFLEGTSHHTGDSIGFVRQGWAFMVRWDSPEHTVADGWSRSSYEAALKKIDADYATVTKWAYTSDLPSICVDVENESAMHSCPQEEELRDNHEPFCTCNADQEQDCRESI